jgi:hypothetical protein
MLDHMPIPANPAVFGIEKVIAKPVEPVHEAPNQSSSSGMGVDLLEHQRLPQSARPTSVRASMGRRWISAMICSGVIPTWGAYQ